MFKKTLLLLGVMAFTMPAMSAELTNPFYVPSKGTLSSVTSLDTGRSQYDAKAEGKSRSYANTIDEALAFGITDSFAVTASIGNTWQKFKSVPAMERADKDDTNVDFTVGGIYNILYQGPTKLQVKAVYGQKESDSHDNKGAYKYAKAGVKAGYDLGYFLPYASADIEVPVAQSKYGNDKNTYEARGGIYKLFCNTWAVDAGVGYKHVEKYEETAWTVDAEVSYFITQNITAGLYGSYMMDGKAKYNADLSDRKVGLRLRAAF